MTQRRRHPRRQDLRAGRAHHAGATCWPNCRSTTAWSWSRSPAPSSRRAIENGLSLLPRASGAFRRSPASRSRPICAARPAAASSSMKVGGAPLDEGKIYRVAVNDFLARGGDDYTMFRDAKRITPRQRRAAAGERGDGLSAQDRDGADRRRGADRAGEVALPHRPLVRDHLAVVRQAAGRDELHRAAAASSPPAASRRPPRCKPGVPASAHSAMQRHRVLLAVARDGEPQRGRARDGACRLRRSAPGCTNMPFTLVVWSARPIQPLMRMLVRPQGERAGHHRGQVAGRKPDHRIVRIERR